MKRLLLLLALLPLVVFAQKNRNIDSALRVIATAKNDTQKVNTLNWLACLNWETEYDRCIKNATQAIELGHKAGYIKGEVEGYLNRGDVYYSKSSQDTALADYNKAIAISKKAKYLRGEAMGYNNIGVIMRIRGDWSEAITYFQKAADIFEKINDLDGSSDSYSHLANNYNQMEQFDKALVAYKKAYALRKQIKYEIKAAQSLAGIGLTYRNKQLNAKDKTNFKQAIKYLEQALHIFIKLKYDVNISLGYKELGITYLQVDDYKGALKNLLKAEEVFTRIGFRRELGSLYKGIGKCYMYTGDYAKAKTYLEKALQASINENYQQHIMESYQELYTLYKMMGDDKQSLAYHEKYVAEKDSIINRKNYDKLAEVTTRYEAEKKEQKITLLNKENTIQKLSLAEQKTTTGIVAGIFVATAAFGGVLYNRNKLKQKGLLQSKMIEQQELLTKAVLDAEENERKRIAGDLHDGVGQLFSAVKLNLNGLLDRLNIERDEDRFLAENTLALVDESCKEVRIISHRMMPNMLLRSGLASDLKSFIEKIDSDSLKVTLHATGFRERLESNIETMLYRIIQETVNNVIKHAHANKLDIALHRDKEGISAVITDNGKGFDASKRETFTGIGLKNIQTRIEYLKGTVHYDSAPGMGTTVNIFVPEG